MNYKQSLPFSGEKRKQSLPFSGEKRKQSLRLKPWLDKAREDEIAGKELLDAHIPALACFHFQQVAEKYLKALTIFHQIRFRKIHDLLELETLLLKVEPDVNGVHLELELLRPYYVESRYPGNFPTITQEAAQQAYQAVLKIKEFVLYRINL